MAEVEVRQTEGEFKSTLTDRVEAALFPLEGFLAVLARCNDMYTETMEEMPSSIGEAGLKLLKSATDEIHAVLEGAES